MNKILRMIPNEEFHQILNSEYKYTYCRVYYGFDCYRDDPEYINDIVKVINDELSYVTNDLMHIKCISRDQSVAHAGHTTIAIVVKTDDIKKNFSSYTIL